MRLAPRRTSQAGYAMIIATFFVAVFSAFALTALQLAATGSDASIDQLYRLDAETAATSAMNYTIAKIRRGGISAYSRSDVAFGSRGAHFDIQASVVANVVTMITRGQAAETSNQYHHTVYQRGMMRTGKFIPSAALYFGNGAIENPRGNYFGNATDSYISNRLDFRFAGWNHPYDFISNPIATPPTTNARWRDQDPLSPRFGENFNVFESQTSFGRSNILDFVAPWKSGSTTYKPESKIEKMPGADVYPTYQESPDVQTFAFDLWATKTNRDLVLTAEDVAKGNYDDNAGPSTKTKGLGTIQDPRIVFVTGSLLNAAKSFRGAGILVVRDDFDPQVGGNRNVTQGKNVSVNGKTYGIDMKKAAFDLRNTFQWTGMVIIAGWAPAIDTGDLPSTSTMDINGTLMGEDSVQSGGETSLDEATIQLYIGKAINSTEDKGNVNVNYSKDVFSPKLPSGVAGLTAGAANPIYGFLPEVQKTVVSMENTSARASWVPVGW